MKDLIIKVLNKLSAFRYLNFTKRISLNGKRFIVPVMNNIGQLNLNISEPWMIDVLKIVLSIENKGFIDVGVNEGQTLLKLKSVSDEINYIGFEPNPNCINYVNNLIKKNQFKNTVVIPVGISTKTEVGVLHFYEDSVTDSSASMISNFRESKSVKRKEFIPLFDFKDLKAQIELDHISVLKIDVEGGELEVISSFKEELLEKKPIILIEILPAYNDKNTSRIERQDKIQDILLELNYYMYRVVKKKNQLFKLERITKIEIHSDLDTCDYVMVPDTKVEKFEMYMQ